MLDLFIKQFIIIGEQELREVNMNDYTHEVIRAVEAEATERMKRGNKMDVMIAVAWASGYAGHRGIDLLVFFEALEDMYHRKLLKGA